MTFRNFLRHILKCKPYTWGLCQRIWHLCRQAEGAAHRTCDARPIQCHVHKIKTAHIHKHAVSQTGTLKCETWNWSAKMQSWKMRKKQVTRKPTKITLM